MPRNPPKFALLFQRFAYPKARKPVSGVVNRKWRVELGSTEHRASDLPPDAIRAPLLSAGPASAPDAIARSSASWLRFATFVGAGLDHFAPPRDLGSFRNSSAPGPTGRVAKNFRLSAPPSRIGFVSQKFIATPGGDDPFPPDRHPIAQVSESRAHPLTYDCRRGSSHAAFNISNVRPGRRVQRANGNRSQCWQRLARRWLAGR